MSMTAAMLVLVLLFPIQTGRPATPASMQDDVDRLVRAAGRLTESWPSQAPPALPEVGDVARHGTPAAPLLMALLPDAPDAASDRRRWKVQQQAALALCRIYAQSPHCGRVYCDGDSAERIRSVKDGWVRVIEAEARMRTLSAADLLDRFRREPVFWRQFEIGSALAATGDRDAIAALEGWLTHDDRHLRGNVAFVLGRLGDRRGFDTIAGILADRGPRSQGQGTTAPRWTLPAQIRADRYYAAHLLGDLKDPRGVDLLIPLLRDEDVDDVVPWALSRIGDRRAIAPLVAALDQDDASARVLAIDALERLNAVEALPRLRALLQDTRKAGFGDQATVAEAARRAIAVISPVR